MTDTHDRATRRFLKTVAGGAMGLAAGRVLAQSGAAGEQSPYREVRPAQPTDVPEGKIEVLEFFWYGCPHCNSLEPLLKDWAAKLPSDVVFRKVHVGLGPSWVAHQRLFYTLDSMGKTAALNQAVFNAIHVDRNNLMKPEAMADFLVKHGVDRAQFLDIYDSFAVRTKVRKASSTAAAFGLDGVPAFAVNGRWMTSPAMAGGGPASLKVLDMLIERERKGVR